MIDLFNTVLVHPIINLLVAFYDVLLFLHVPYALGFAIILLTAAIRLVLLPFTNSQMKASKKMQDVAPHVNRLKEQHKGDAKRLQEETMKLYKEFGINPVAGCLPVLIQLPLIWALYGVLREIVALKPAETVAFINKVIFIPGLKLHSAWDTTFFGLPIGHTPSQLLGSVGFLILLVPLITGVLQFVQSKMMFPAVKKPVEKDKAKKEDKPMDMASAMQTQSTYILPAMIGYFSFQFPLGLSLYWNTFTIFGIIQQYLMQKEKKTEVSLVSSEPKKLVGKQKKGKKHYGK